MIPRMFIVEDGCDCPYGEDRDYDKDGVYRAWIYCTQIEKECAIDDGFPICPLPHIPVKLPEDITTDEIDSAIRHGWNMCRNFIINEYINAK